MIEREREKNWKKGGGEKEGEKWEEKEERGIRGEAETYLIGGALTLDQFGLWQRRAITNRVIMGIQQYLKLYSITVLVYVYCLRVAKSQVPFPGRKIKQRKFVFIHSRAGS